MRKRKFYLDEILAICEQGCYKAFRDGIKAYGGYFDHIVSQSLLMERTKTSRSLKESRAYSGLDATGNN